MRIWVLIGLTDYASSDVLGVYTSWEKADAARDGHVAARKAFGFDGYDIEPFEVDE